jgi:hypothetical protein
MTAINLLRRAIVSPLVTKTWMRCQSYSYERSRNLRLVKAHDTAGTLLREPAGDLGLLTRLLCLATQLLASFTHRLEAFPS